VNDHRVRTNANGSIDGSGPFLEARFLIGDFVVKTTGEMTNCDLKLDLWNAELIGTIHTTKGVFSYPLKTARNPSYAFPKGNMVSMGSCIWFGSEE
jgi:hypothetical protein